MGETASQLEEEEEEEESIDLRKTRFMKASPVNE